MAEELAQAKQRMTELEEQVFSSLAAQYEGAGNVLLFQPPTRPDGVRKLADAVAKRCGGRAAVFAGAGDQYTYAVIQANRPMPAGIASRTAPGIASKIRFRRPVTVSRMKIRPSASTSTRALA